MIKIYCDRCGQEIEGVKHCEIRYNILGNMIPINVDLCKSCTAEFCKFLDIVIPWEQKET